MDSWDPQMDFLEPKNVFFWNLKCFKPASEHISHDIDQENSPSSEFPSLYKTIWTNLAHSSQKLAFLDPIFGPQIDFLEPKNTFFWFLKCFRSSSGHIYYDIHTFFYKNIVFSIEARYSYIFRHFEPRNILKIFLFPNSKIWLKLRVKKW